MPTDGARIPADPLTGRRGPVRRGTAPRRLSVANDIKPGASNGHGHTASGTVAKGRHAINAIAEAPAITRVSGARQAGTRRQRGPSVAVRGKADGAHRPGCGTNPVRYTSMRSGPLTEGSTDGHGRRRQEAALSHPGPALLVFHLPLFRMPARRRRLPRRRVRARRPCVGDPPVGGVSLTVDAVGVDLEQDRDAVPGAAGDLGRGTPEFSHGDTAACRRSYGRRGRPGGRLAVSVRAHALGRLVVAVGISADGQMADHDVIPRKVVMIAWLSRWSRR
jgi:hypothetical protein